MGVKLDKIKRNGYWYILKSDHPFSHKQGYIAEHRLVMEKYIGRYLKPSEVIHHINGIKTDNRIENLELCESHGKHTLKHHPEVIEKLGKYGIGRTPWNKNKRIKTKCPICQNVFENPLNKHKKKFCSLNCYWESKKGKTPSNMEGLKLGRGWNKGLPMTWALKGKDSASYKHGKFSKYI